jgi:phosphate transport system substrate-binding protein
VISMRARSREFARAESVLVAAALTLCAAGAGCGSRVRTPPTPVPQVLRIKGSDTMFILIRQWAARFMADHGGISVQVEGGGSRSGIRALIDGQTDICATSRPVEPAEIRALQEKRGSLGMSVLCAKDALSIYLNPRNRVRNLTLSQLGGILNGRIRNWAEVGGDSAEISVYGRKPGSGTYAFLADHVLGGEAYRPDAVALDGTAQIVDAVRVDSLALGYGWVAYGAGVFHCPINGVPPTPGTVRDGTYPISRYLYLFTAEPPRGAARIFIDWVLSREGQEVVAEVGYVPLWDP